VAVLGVALAGETSEWRIHAAAPAAGERFAVESTVAHSFTAEMRVLGAVLRTIERSGADSAAYTVELSQGPGGALEATIDYGPCPTQVVLRGEALEGNAACDRRRFAITTAPVADDAAADDELRVRLLAEPDAEPAAPPIVHATPQPVARLLAGRVMRDAREVMRGGVLARHLAGAELRAGEAVEIPVDLAAEWLGDPLNGATFEQLRLTPTAARDLDGRSAVAFHAVARATLAAEPKDGAAVTTRYRLEGEVVIGCADGRVLAADLAGPIDCAAAAEVGEEPGRGVDVAGTGTLRWTYRSRPLAR
jgi:hypothetical protein